MASPRRALRWSGVLLILACAAAWASGFFCTVRTWRVDSGVQYEWWMRAGCIEFSRWEYSTTTSSFRRLWRLNRFQPAPWQDFVWAPAVSFFPAGQPTAYPHERLSVVVPLWIPLALVAVPTALTWWAAWRRVPAGRCATCRYDLSGLAAGAGCPECGPAHREAPA